MRVDLLVVARMLDALHEEGRMKKTRLQLYSRLNYPAFKRYLNWLTDRGLVRIVKERDGEYVELTEEGRESYEKLVEWVKKYVSEKL